MEREEREVNTLPEVVNASTTVVAKTQSSNNETNMVRGKSSDDRDV